jgi:hypothetical protein
VCPNHIENLDIDGKIILEWVIEKYGGKVWPAFMAQDRDQYQAVVSVVVNFQVP